MRAAYALAAAVLAPPPIFAFVPSSPTTSAWSSRTPLPSPSPRTGNVALQAISPKPKRAPGESLAAVRRARAERKAREEAAAGKGTQQQQQQQQQSPLDATALERRATILGRDGDHFALDRSNGRVEFGSTVDLITPLDDSSGIESVGLWLSDARRVAGGIWDEKLLTDLGQSTYRLGLMPLKFVTIQLAPTVDVKMWTDIAECGGEDEGALPTFRLHSIGFEPNVELLPGVGFDSQSLGIEIEVCGELRPTKDGKGVAGKIGFVSSGYLSPPLRILPDSVLKPSSSTISRTVRDFAVESFQAGAVKQYAAFQMKEEEMKEQKS